MLYILLDIKQIKILYLKKNLLGHYETAFYQKQFTTNLLENGRIANVDIMASAIREALTTIPNAATKEKQVTLILPQNSLVFLRQTIPLDISPAVIQSYLGERGRSDLSIDIHDYFFTYFIAENSNQKQLHFYAIEKRLVELYRQPFGLLDLEISDIIPEALAIYKMFDKTLRKDKKENILFVHTDENWLSGYIYDSYGLLEKERWHHEIQTKETIQSVLKQKALDYELKGNKLNRIILSGKQSETIRQDTFTKEVGVWTNPLKRIIPHFYQNYLKMLNTGDNNEIPVLEYDSCIGAFILTIERKEPILLNVKMSQVSDTLPTQKQKLFIKPLIFFLLSAIIAFIVLFFGSKISFSPLLASLPFSKMKPTPTPTATPSPSPTPTPPISKEKIKIKVLNGSGISGKASQVKELLRKKGYVEILTGNADNFDYKQTEIQIKKSLSDFQTTLGEDIKESVSKPKYSSLEAESAADIVIIIGSDFK